MERIAVAARKQGKYQLSSKSPAKPFAWQSQDLFTSHIRLGAHTRKGIILAATRGTFLHASGIPSDDAIYSLGYGQSELLPSDPIHSDTGTLFVVPILPLNGGDFECVVKCIEKNFKKFGFMPFMTFNLVEQSNLEGVINLTFNRTDQVRVSAADRCILDTFEALLHAGYPPLRMSIFQMPYLKQYPRMVDEGHRKTVRDLKNIFDPDNIIARGRYEFA